MGTNQPGGTPIVPVHPDDVPENPSIGGGGDGLAARYPLTLAPSSGLQTVESWTTPHIEHAPLGVPVNTTVAETSLLATPWAIGANEVAPLDVIEIVAWGNYLNNAGGDDMDVRLRWGGTAGVNLMQHRLGTAPLTASASRRAWVMKTIMVVNEAGTGFDLTSDMDVTALGGTQGGTLGVVNTLRNTRNGAIAVSLTAAVNLDLTVQHAEANAALDLTCVRAIFKHAQARPA